MNDASMEPAVWVGSLMFALLVTTVLSGVGFNQPSWSRTFTTAGRFRIAFALHVSAYLLFLFACYAVLVRIVRIAGMPVESLRTTLIWIALTLTVCLRLVPTLARAVRRRAHRLAGIPLQAQAFAKFLAETSFEADAKVQTQAVDLLRARGVDAECDWLPPAQPLIQQTLRTTEIFLQLRAWETSPPYARYVREVEHELYRLRQRFDRLSFRVARTLASIGRLGEVKLVVSQSVPNSPELDEILRHLVNEMIADVCEDLSMFYRDACMLAARGIMATEQRRSQRNAAAARLGFATAAREPTELLRVFAYAAVLLFAGLVAFFNVLPPSDGFLISIDQRLAIIMVTVMGTLAIASVPTRYFGFATGGLHHRTPIAFIVGAGVCAFLFAVLVRFAAGALLFHGLEGALTLVVEGRPYLPSSFLTAMTVAWLVQEHRWPDVHQQWTRRALDALVFGVTWLAASLLSRWILADEPGEFINWRTLAVTALGFVFGALMGLLVPEFVRRRPLIGATAGFSLPISNFDIPVSVARGPTSSYFPDNVDRHDTGRLAT